MDAITISPFTAQDADWVVARHAALYRTEEGFDDSFGVLVGQIVGDFLAQNDPTREAGWIARQGDLRLGSIFVVTEAPGIAKLRLVLIEPQMRGTGLAQRMMDQALGFARHAGYAQMRLWTHESHVAAGRLYARNGFGLISSEERRSFGQDVVAQIWERPL